MSSPNFRRKFGWDFKYYSLKVLQVLKPNQYFFNQKFALDFDGIGTKRVVVVDVEHIVVNRGADSKE